MTTTPIRVLLITDHVGVVQTIQASITDYHGGTPATDTGLAFEHADRMWIGLERLATNEFDVVLADLSVPDGQGLQTYARLYAQAPDTSIIVLVDRDDELLALKAVQFGAQDYLIKDQLSGGLVVRSIYHAVQNRTRENELAAERERLTVTLRSIGDGVITADADGHIVLLNHAAETLTGWTQEEARGRPLDEVFRIFDEKTRQRLGNPIDRVLREGSFGRFESAVLVARDGTERLIEESSAPIRDRESAIDGVVLVFRDVTTRRRLEEERLRASKLESIGGLAGGIAHDFNNLLTTILGNLSLAREQVPESDPARDFLARAEAAALMARDLTRQLLTFAEGGAPIRETSSLEDLIGETVHFTLRGSNILPEISIPSDLWPVEVDEGQFSHVIGHLITNARQAMSNGGRVHVTCENVLIDDREPHGMPDLEPGRYVKIAIEDEGVGIEPEHLPRIFDPYFSTRPTGSGLGLAICYSVVTRHGGKITVRSDPGIRTVFTILLPAASAAIVEVGPTVESGTAGGARVLLMDDDAMIRLVVRRMLERLGHTTATAEDGAEAIEIFRQAHEEGNPFDVVIMDLTVPGGMGGKEAVHHLRAIEPGLKAIVSSGYFNDPIMANHKEYGFDGVIAKPFQLEGLRRALAGVLGGGDGR